MLLAVAVLAACQVSTVSIPAFEAAVGTSNFSDAGPFALFVYYLFRLENYAPSGINVVVRGPAGWNGGNPMMLPNDFVAGRRGNQWTWWAFGPGAGPCDPVTTFVCQAISGEYTIEATFDGATHSVRATIDANSFLLRTATLTVTSATTSQVEASWSTVSGAETYEARLRRADNFQILATFRTRTGTATSFTNLNLDPAVSHDVTLRAFTVDVSSVSNPPRLSGQFNSSRRTSAAFSPTATGAVMARPMPTHVRMGEREFGQF